MDTIYKQWLTDIVLVGVMEISVAMLARNSAVDFLSVCFEVKLELTDGKNILEFLRINFFIPTLLYYKQKNENTESWHWYCVCCLATMSHLLGKPSSIPEIKQFLPPTPPPFPLAGWHHRQVLLFLLSKNTPLPRDHSNWRQTKARVVPKIHEVLFGFG